MGSIKPNDLNELKKLGKPSDIIKLIFDCVSLLKMAPLQKVEPMEVTLGTTLGYSSCQDMLKPDSISYETML